MRASFNTAPSALARPRGTLSQQKASRPQVLARASRRPQDSPDLDNYYDLLEVDAAADEETIKQSYRRMQMRWHPDIAGKAGEEMSAKLNVAYAALLNPEARRAYNMTPRRKQPSVRTKEGLVGVFNEAVVFEANVPVPADPAALTTFELVDAISDWAKTMAFTTELPLPYPLQVDQLPDGVRMAVVTVSSGVVRTIGELLITVTESEPAEAALGEPAPAGRLVVEVMRRWTYGDRSGPLPGEDRILKVFKAEFEDLIKTEQDRAPFQLGGFFAAMAAFALPALPTMPGFNSESAPGGYKAYRLSRSCRLGADGRQPVAGGGDKAASGGNPFLDNSSGF